MTYLPMLLFVSNATFDRNLKEYLHKVNKNKILVFRICSHRACNFTKKWANLTS